MSGYIIFDEITIDFDLLTKNQQNGEDHTQCNIDRHQTDYVRQVFGEHERTIITPGQGLPIIRKPDEPNFTIGEYTEFPIRPKY